MSHPSRLTILVIDDCDQDRMVYRHFLRHDALCAYSIFELSTVNEAIKWCEQETPDVILLDFFLPDGDGLEFLQQLRENLNNSQSAVIMLTGQGDERIAVSAIKNGAQDYLVKSKLTPEMLQRTIRTAFKQMHLTWQLKQSQELQSIAKIALRIRQTLQLEENLNITVTEVRQFLNADRGLIYQFLPDMSGTVVAESVLPGWTVALGRDIQDTCFQNGAGSDYRLGKKRAINDIYQAGLTDCHLQLLEQFEVKAYLVVPILVTNQLWGLLIVHQCSAPRPWQAVELDLLDQLAVQIAIAIQQASAYEQLRVELAERKQVEETLRQKDERLNMALEAAGMGNWDWNIQTGEIYWSANQERIFGMIPGSFSGNYETVVSMMHPDDRQTVLQAINAAVYQKQEYNIEFRFIKPDGTVRWALTRGRVFYDEIGNPLRMMGVDLDITARKQAEALLQESEGRFRYIADTMPVLIWISGTDKLCHYFNQTWLDFTGRTLEQELGNAWAEGVHPDDFQYCLNTYINAFDARKSFQMEYRLKRFDGEYRWILDHGIPRFTPDGHFLGYMGSCVDITDRIVAEETLQQLNQVLEARVEQRTAALRESEERWQLALRGSNDGIWDWNIKTNQVFFSSRWKEMRGFAADEISFNIEEWFSLIHPDDYNRVIQAIADHFAQQTPFLQEEYRVKCKDGSYLWVLDRGQALWDTAGSPIRISGSSTDITKRKLAEEELRKNQAHLSAAQRVGRLGSWEFNLQTQEGWWSQEIYEIYGRNPNEPPPKNIEENLQYIHPDDWEYFQDHYQTLLEDGHQELEYRLLHPDGIVKYVLMRVEVIFDAQNRPLSIVGAILDITKGKQVEAKLLALNILQQAIFNESADALFLVDPETLLTLDCNRRAVEVFEAAEKGELIGIAGHSLQQHQFTPDELVAISKEMQVKGFWSREIEYITYQGRSFWGNIAAKLITIDGRTLHLVRITDITDRKQAEEQLRHTNEQLARANVELARATSLKDEFLANMSHELRTPLNAILGMSEGLLESVFGSINERQIKAIGTIERSGKHLLELINDILDLSKIESGKLELQLSDVAVKSLCNDSLAFVRQMALKKNICLSTIISENIRNVVADDRCLRQVLINLLTNAIKFTPEGGSVKLEVSLKKLEIEKDAQAREQGETEAVNPEFSTLPLLSPSSPYLCFSITDTGIGIASEEMGKLFQPFMQLDSSLNRHYNGTGLGLALVKRITTLHGGKVSVSSEVGRGSCFTVCIPYLSSNSFAAATQQTPVLSSYQIPVDNVRVLVIEDSVTASDQIVRYLGEFGMQSVVYPRGEGAVNEALRIKPSIILLDLQLSNLSGWDVLSQLKANPQTREIPVIIISVMDERSKGLAKGASAYLVKPITRAQFQATLEKFQYPAPAQETAAITVLKSPLEPPLILLAEDNQANIDTMSGYLESRGYRIILAKNGQEAIDIAKSQQPNLIVMDIQMPVIDGLEAMRRIRQDQQLLRVPILALTALAMPTDRETCLAAGANEYLTKPVKLKQLATAIQKLLVEVAQIPNRH